MVRWRCVAVFNLYVVGCCTLLPGRVSLCEQGMSSHWLDSHDSSFGCWAAACLARVYRRMRADLLQCWCGTACAPDYDKATAVQWPYEHAYAACDLCHAPCTYYSLTYMDFVLTTP
jgi:hypothetical protein